MIERRKSLRNDPAYMLAVLYTIGFLGVVFLIIIKDVPKESAPIVQQLISIMSMIQAAIAGYFYGSSKAAAESNQSLSRIAEAPAAAPNGAPSVTPAPATPEGIIPAAEVAQPPKDTKP